MISKAGMVLLLFVAGCGGTNLSRVGPNGHFYETEHEIPIAVREVWKYDLRPRTQTLVAKEVPNPKTAAFGEQVKYEGYYDSSLDVTLVTIWGNVNWLGDYGQLHRNGYYVKWQQRGRVDQQDFLPPWQLVDIQVLDTPY